MASKQPRKPRAKRTGKGNPKDYYFGPAVDEAIVAYNKCTDPEERSRIYSKDIKYAFEKLVENTINVNKLYQFGNQTMEQAQHEVISFLVEKLTRYRAESGKGFSYFNIIAKRYCILRSKTSYKRLVSHIPLEDTTELACEDTPYSNEDEIRSPLDIFTDQFVAYWDKQLSITFHKKSDEKLAAAVVELFRMRDQIELFNKKALYIYVREMTGANTPRITRMVRIIKAKYKAMYEDFLVHGKVLTSKSY